LTDGDVNKAAKVLKRFYEIKQQSPVLFGKRDPDSVSIQRQMNVQEMAPLRITDDNNFIFLHRVLNANPKEFNFNVVYRTFMMMAGVSINFLRR
jgi:hypothetical protein